MADTQLSDPTIGATGAQGKAVAADQAKAVSSATHPTTIPSATVTIVPTPGAPANQEGVVVVGRVGGPFNINGEGFGTSGTLMISGRTIPTTRWNDVSIKGQLPDDLKPGPIVLKVAGKPDQKGEWK